MNAVKPCLAVLKKRRNLAMWSVLFVLIVIIFCIPLLPESKKPPVASIYTILMAIVTNVFAALLWYSLLVTHQNLEKTDPLMRAFPFLRNKSQDILIVLASLPTTLGHELTGIGEARGLGILLESFSTVNFPPQQIVVRFSSEYDDSAVEEILRTKHVIILGGPNFNKFAKNLRQ